MIDFRSRKSGEGVQAGDAAGRLGRLAGRVVLWGCVLVLLLRGIASVLAGPPQPASSPSRPLVTVTRAAPPVLPTARGRRAP